jgi:type I restriction enzyme S subunit
MSYAGKQSTRPKLNKSVLDKIPVVYPNKTTQKKIVQKLDYILGQLEEKKKEINKYANFEKYDNLLKTSTQKVLSDAFRGKLTERKSSDSSVVEFLKKINPKRENFLAFHDCVPHDIPKEWIWVEINQICDGIVPGRYKPTEFDGDIPWITISDIQNFYTHGSLKNLGVTESAVKKVNMKILPPDTVLMTCIGDVGRTSILKCRGVPNQQLHGFVCKNGMISEYISYAIMSQQSIISKISSKTTVAYLNKTKCNNILIPLAPPEEQKRLIQKIQEKFYEIETLSNKINNIKNSHYLLLNRLDRFSNVILNKAFSGKLVN